ncbi:SMI1/KNR4 family protein [Luteolibacter sp. LG18]|uniref:SMI1/KNR4 family protein n=1 Tax=Luteolibacter sp. LG18 TaxID=2819286 RepID=UPI002B2EE5A2|nr:hypothetical protein llg_27850 [Luteolibacter sp. LG18]
MSIQGYQSAKSLIEEAGGDFEGEKAESLVGMAEQVLNLKFPPSYRRFLLEMGCGDINGLEIYGIIDDEFEDSCVPNGIWLTLNERRNIGLGLGYILIGDGGDGSYYAIDVSKVDEFGESPVVRIAADGKEGEPVANNFGDYLLHAVEEVV